MKILLLSVSLDKVPVSQTLLIGPPGRAKVETTGPEIYASVQETIKNLMVIPIAG
jgi:hypothetical protein